MFNLFHKLFGKKAPLATPMRTMNEAHFQTAPGQWPKGLKAGNPGISRHYRQDVSPQPRRRDDDDDEGSMFGVALSAMASTLHQGEDGPDVIGGAGIPSPFEGGGGEMGGAGASGGWEDNTSNNASENVDYDPPSSSDDSSSSSSDDSSSSSDSDSGSSDSGSSDSGGSDN